MGNGGIRHQCHGVSKGNAVIAAQSRTLCGNAVAVMGHIQTLYSHVYGAGSILLADHIHVTLQDHRFVVFHTACAVLEDDHVIQLVLNVAQTMFLGKADQIVTDHFGVAGAMGNRADLFKISKYRSRFKTCQFYSIHSRISFVWDIHILPQMTSKVHPLKTGKNNKDHG